MLYHSPTNLPLNSNSRVCSRHFKNSHGRILRHDEYPTENLPQLPTRVSTPTPRRPLLRRHAPDQHKNSDKQQECLQLQDIGVNTDTDEEVSMLTSTVAQLEREVSILHKESDLSVSIFRLQTSAGDDAKVAFIQGFHPLHI